VQEFWLAEKCFDVSAYVKSGIKIEGLSDGVLKKRYVVGKSNYYAASDEKILRHKGHVVVREGVGRRGR
jgi:hypothetical protein